MESIRKLIREMRHYLALQREYAMMDTADKLTSILSAVAIATVCLLLCSMIFFFLALALAVWIGTLAGSLLWGFVGVAALVLLVLAVVWWQRDAWIVQPLARMMIRLFVTKDDNNDDPQETLSTDEQG